MKKLVILTCIFAIISCSREKSFTVSNPLNEDIVDKSTVLTRADVMKFLDDTNFTGVLYARTETGEWLPTQCDDLNGDGNWDELAFLCDLGAGETAGIAFEIPDTMPEFPQRTNIRFGRMTKPFDEVSGDLRMKTNETKFTAPVYQMEGPAWENDVIAFRNYYDARSGIDIFGKTTAEMVMDSVGVNGREYHTLADWGMDILKVGNSLGAGAIAIGIGDSLYRVGPCESGSYRVVAEGPVRSILDLTYLNVPAGERSYNVTHRIAIHAGDRFYRSQVWVSELKGDESLVTGIVNLHNVPADTLSGAGMRILYSLGNQGYSNEILGMAVLIPTDQLKKYGEAPAEGSGIVSTHLAWLNLYYDKPTEYRFMAAWETENPQVREKEYFISLVQEAVKR